MTLSEFSYIFLLFTILYAPVAQLVEQLPFKETVEGSSPSGRTTIQKDVFMTSFCVDASECINCFMHVKDLKIAALCDERGGEEHREGRSAKKLLEKSFICRQVLPGAQIR